MFQGKRQSIIIGAVIIVAVALIFIKLSPEKAQKQRPPTAKEAAQNECSVEAYKKYLEKQVVLNETNTSDPLSFLSIEKILARRRLQEQFCLEFVRCVPQNPRNGLASQTEATMFDSCLRDETLDEYDAVLRQDDDDN